jgi:hypothetical protein
MRLLFASSRLLFLIGANLRNLRIPLLLWLSARSPDKPARKKMGKIWREDLARVAGIDSA